MRGISMDVAKREIVSIVGPSGAGKTTLLQIMGTLERADEGTVVVDGVPVGEPQTVDTAQGTISITVQGTGKQLVDVYFDGVRGHSETVDFGS